MPLTNRSKPFIPGNPPISIGTSATDQPLTRCMLTLLTATLWDLSRVGIPELRSADQRAIAPPPI
ncbi:hypothetical protein [Leptolyngbya sp. Heron Island J]|uniref:hypothetical protein n=1 Tax=Leptolyngbya sp. Heron Island J TaxID=1385935 RepID=UPI0012684521|nr:hypothetical protein [Leptolyngbya sp. Heron Island J]